MLKNLDFYSDGYKLSGNLYLPQGYNKETPLPLIILCHGFAGVKELLLPDFASAFAQEGYAVFSFDYRGFGESEGPEGQLIPEEQVRDIKNAITFTSSLEEVDSSRIGLWGTSLGGANALITSATDKRIKALCVQITFGNGERNNTFHMSEQEKTKRKSAINKALLTAAIKNKTLKLPLKKILSDEQSKKFLDDYAPLFSHAFKVKIPFTTTGYIDDWKPEEYLHKIHIPVLITGASNDLVNHPKESEEIYNRLASNEKKLFMTDSTHYNIYTGEDFKAVSNEQTLWFNKYL